MVKTEETLTYVLSFHLSIQVVQVRVKLKHGFYIWLLTHRPPQDLVCSLQPRHSSRMSSGAEDGSMGGISVINFLGDFVTELQSLFFSFSIRSKDFLLAACGSAAGVSSLICIPVLSLTCPCNLTAGRLALRLLSVFEFFFGDNRKQHNISQD